MLWPRRRSPAARAADTVLVGSVDATSANRWPIYVAQRRAIFDAADLKLDVVFAQSNASVIQQLAAGSFNIAPMPVMVDPIRAIEKGAPIAIVRIVMQAPPYALLAKPAIKSIKDLKGKTIIDRRRQGHHPHLRRAHAGAERRQDRRVRLHFRRRHRARFSALQSGAVDAAILTVPFNFYAQTAGFTNLGFTFEYVPDMPFAGDGGQPQLGNAQSEGGRAIPRRDPEGRRLVRGSREPSREAVKLMVEHSKLKQEDVEKSYEFLRGKHLFEPTGKVSRAQARSGTDALKELGDVPKDFPVERLFLPGVTQL